MGIGSIITQGTTVLSLPEASMGGNVRPGRRHGMALFFSHDGSIDGIFIWMFPIMMGFPPKSSIYSICS